jgi:hypothetical protein
MMTADVIGRIAIAIDSVGAQLNFATLGSSLFNRAVIVSGDARFKNKIWERAFRVGAWGRTSRWRRDISR